MQKLNPKQLQRLRGIATASLELSKPDLPDLGIAPEDLIVACDVVLGHEALEDEDEHDRTCQAPTSCRTCKIRETEMTHETITTPPELSRALTRALTREEFDTIQPDTPIELLHGQEWWAAKVLGRVEAVTMLPAGPTGRYKRTLARLYSLVGRTAGQASATLGLGEELVALHESTKR